jgi:prepilin-type N-terminal cleavage/methylation domain-containing protein
MITGRKAKAFTLVEVIIALLILGWSMLTTVEMVDMRLRSFYRARTRATVIKLAQAKADELMGITAPEPITPAPPTPVLWIYFDPAKYPSFSMYQYKLEVSTLNLRTGTAPLVAAAPPTGDYENLQRIIIRVRGPVNDPSSPNAMKDEYRDTAGIKFAETRLPIIVVVKRP